MSIIRWQRPGPSAWPTFENLFGLRGELQRLVESPLGEIARGVQFQRVWNPALDLYEDKDNVFVKAEVPGLKKEDIDVSLEDGVLTISGERKSEQKSDDAETHRSERFVGRFNRSLTLPSEVKADEVKASYQDGILTVTLPKAEAAKPKQIEVKID
jgi:HSP20 family protein